MTGIIEGFPTKKALRAAVQHAQESGGNIAWTNPTPFGVEHWSLRALSMNASATVTNHPKRSWFASITRTGLNKWSVK